MDNLSILNDNIVKCLKSKTAFKQDNVDNKKVYEKLPIDYKSLEKNYKLMQNKYNLCISDKDKTRKKLQELQDKYKLCLADKSKIQQKQLKVVADLKKQIKTLKQENMKMKKEINSLKDKILSFPYVSKIVSIDKSKLEKFNIKIGNYNATLDGYYDKSKNLLFILTKDHIDFSYILSSIDSIGDLVSVWKEPNKNNYWIVVKWKGNLK